MFKARFIFVCNLGHHRWSLMPGVVSSEFIGLILILRNILGDILTVVFINTTLVLLNLNFSLEGRSHAVCSLTLAGLINSNILHCASWTLFLATLKLFLVLLDFLAVIRNDRDSLKELIWWFRTPRRVCFFFWRWFSGFNFFVNRRHCGIGGTLRNIRFLVGEILGLMDAVTNNVILLL